MQKPQDPNSETRKAKEIVTDEGNVPGRPAASTIFVIALLIGGVLLLMHHAA